MPCYTPKAERRRQEEQEAQRREQEKVPSSHHPSHPQVAPRKCPLTTDETLTHGLRVQIRKRSADAAAARERELQEQRAQEVSGGVHVDAMREGLHGSDTVWSRLGHGRGEGHTPA